MGNKLGEQTIKFTNKPIITGAYSIVGKKEGEGNLGEYFDYVLKKDDFGEKTYEHAERKMLEFAINHAMNKAKLTISDIDLLLSGDLLNQIISASYSARQFDTSYLGLYGACSTMAESLAIGSCLIDGKYFKNVACATGSHFSSAERQYRFPLELGNQRPPVSQWTVTGAGCTIISSEGAGCEITHATFGKVVDWGITDANNMGAAMAPAAMQTLIAHFEDTNTTPDDFDLILTGDLGKLGSEIFMDLMEHRGYKLGTNHGDCGQMIYNSKQKTYQGGSGTGCSAAVLNSYIHKKILDGTYKKVLFAATGALLSTVSTQQGDSIPSICHAVVIENSNTNMQNNNVNGNHKSGQINSSKENISSNKSNLKGRSNQSTNVKNKSNNVKKISQQNSGANNKRDSNKQRKTKNAKKLTKNENKNSAKNKKNTKEGR